MSNVSRCSVVTGVSFSRGSLPSLSFNPGSPTSISGLSWDLPTLEEIESLVCWGLTQGVDSFISLDPVELSAQALKAAAYRNCLDEGVVYGSGGADYAEWLERIDSDEHI